MRKVFSSLVLVMTVIVSSAQEVRLNVYSAYVFDDSYDSYYDANNFFNGKVNGGYQWGIGVEFLPAHPAYGMELSYIHQSTHAPTSFKTGVGNAARTENFKLGLNYIMFGGDGHMVDAAGKVDGYGGLAIGLLIASLEAPSNGNSATHTAFAWSVRGGMNYWVSKKVAIKVQAQLLAASRAVGGDYYFSYYGPIEVVTYRTLWQFGLGGGLSFRFGH